MDLNVKRPSTKHALALRTALLYDTVEHEVHSNRDACHPRCIPLHGPTRFRVRPGSCDHLSLSLIFFVQLNSEGDLQNAVDVVERPHVPRPAPRTIP